MKQHPPVHGTHHSTTVMPAKAGIDPSHSKGEAAPIGKTVGTRQPEWIPAFAGMTDRELQLRSRQQKALHPTSVMPAKAGIHPSRSEVEAAPIGETVGIRQPEWIPAYAGMTAVGIEDVVGRAP